MALTMSVCDMPFAYASLFVFHISMVSSIVKVGADRAAQVLYSGGPTSFVGARDAFRQKQHVSSA